MSAVVVWAIAMLAVIAVAALAIWAQDRWGR